MRALLAAVFVTGCSAPAPAQFLLHIDTDAPLPGGSSGTMPLFDGLRIDVIPADATEACAGCTRELALDESKINGGQVSMGILAPKRAGTRVRVRMSPSWTMLGTAAPESATVESVIALPPLQDGVVHLRLFLAVDDVGKPRGSLDAPIPATLGTVDRGHAGTWRGASRVDCADEPNEGEVCVPGGAFWMLWNARAVDLLPHDPHLVTLSPFFMDANEVTAGVFRSASAQGAHAWSGTRVGTSKWDWCTFGAGNDRAPVNCVDAASAQAYCWTRDADLPSEAQLAYAAGGRARTSYTWGNDPPSCNDAIYGRSGVGLFTYASYDCNPQRLLGGPESVGTAERDRISFGGAEIVDLNGNVSEWTRSKFASTQTDPCWPRGVLVDPECPVSDEPPATSRVLVGGSWDVFSGDLVSFRRGRLPGTERSPEIGFRCVRAAQPK